MRVCDGVSVRVCDGVSVRCECEGVRMRAGDNHKSSRHQSAKMSQDKGYVNS